MVPHHLGHTLAVSSNCRHILSRCDAKKRRLRSCTQKLQLRRSTCRLPGDKQNIPPMYCSCTEERGPRKRMLRWPNFLLCHPRLVRSQLLYRKGVRTAGFVFWSPPFSGHRSLHQKLFFVIPVCLDVSPHSLMLFFFCHHFFLDVSPYALLTCKD